MGCGATKDEKDEAVQKELNGDQAVDRNIKKLLLLGAGGSGKSTLFKQLQSIHGGGFQTRDRKTFRSQIYEQIIEAMKIMITKCEDWQDAIENGEADTELPDIVKGVIDKNASAYVVKYFVFFTFLFFCFL